MAHDVMTTEQAAEFLQTSRDTILRKARRGELPAAKLGREWRFNRTELNAWLADGGDSEEAAFNEAFDREYARRKADPANQRTRPLDEVLAEMGL
ncbi:MAG: helix-turn-helix domain-containing protein [Armatimonadetes bacterium]|nr:helix-turn-helix domain-containing protein [Armatimonadota bacterium]